MMRALRRSKRASGFTLLELLVVVALIAALAAFLFGNVSGGNRASALQAGEATIANLIAAARTRAMASGQSVRVLVHIDTSSLERPRRYLRFLTLQVSTNGQWQAVTDIFLPDGVYVVPGFSTAIPAGLLPLTTSSQWTKTDGTPLRSSVFQTGNTTTETINASAAEQWAYFSIAAAGTTAQSGNIVLAAGRARAPGSIAAGESPVELINPDGVRGLKLSQYGVTTLIDDRQSF